MMYMISLIHFGMVHHGKTHDCHESIILRYQYAT